MRVRRMATQQGCTEYRVKLANLDGRKYHVMRFKPPHECNLEKLENPTLDRQIVQSAEGDLPEQGEGSEYGRRWKEEARKRRRGYAARKASPDDQPWVLREQKKGGKHFIGRREGAGTNSSYYFLSMRPDGAFEAFPVNNWYDFVPPVKYNYLNEEEAEERFERRNKTLNYFSVMLSKKLKGQEDEEEGKGEGEEVGGASKGKGKKKGKAKAADFGLLLTDSSASEESSSEGSDDEGPSKPNKKPDQALEERKRQKKKHPIHSGSEAGEETDEGDVESREVDYMSDSTSESEQEFQAKQAIKEAPKDDEELDRKEEGEIDKGFTETSSSSEDELTEEGREIKALIKKQLGAGRISSAEEEEEEGGLANVGEGEPSGGKPSSRSATPTSILEGKASRKESPKKKPSPDKKSHHAGQQKRELTVEDGGAVSSSTPPSKKQKTESPYTITEHEVQRYLSRKPITSKDLVRKFSSKKTEMEKNKIVEVLGDIIKNMKNVERQKIKGKLYLSLKT